MIGGSDIGWVLVCLTCSDIGVVLGEGEGMVGIVVVGYRGGTMTLAAGNPRRTSSVLRF